MRGQHHPEGYLRHLFRLGDPDEVRIGHCFMRGRLRRGDLVLCLKHSGDCFQDYFAVEQCGGSLKGLPGIRFGSYGVDGAEDLGRLSERNAALLLAGERVQITIPQPEESPDDR